MKTCTLPFSEGYAQQMAPTWAATAGVETAIRKGEVVRLPYEGKAPLCITCLGGTLWVTASGTSEDIVLRPGESWNLERQSLVLVEAIDGDARVMF